MKTIKLLSFMLLLFTLTACDFGGDAFLETSYVIANDPVYYRVYSTNECLEEGIVEIEPMDPDLVYVFQNGEDYVYRMAEVQQTSLCESNLYVEYNDEYIWVSSAYEQGIYTVDELLIAFDNFDFSWIASEGPETVEPTAFIEREYISERGLLIWEADNIDLAANNYCTFNTCSDNQELTKADLDNYFYDHTVDFTKYDVADDTIIAIYHRSGSGEDMEETVQVFLERIGTGEWEFPMGAIWENDLNISDLVVDEN